MKIVAIDEAKHGDVLGADLRGAGGVFVLAKGASLTDSVIGRLKKMGVDSVVVKTRPGEASGGALRDAQVRLAERFAGCEADPFLMEMRRVAEDHVRLRIQE